MEDACDNDECVDDAEWVIVHKDAAGKEHSQQLCGDHLKSFAEYIKAHPGEATVVSINPYKSEDEDEEDEDGEEE